MGAFVSVGVTMTCEAPYSAPLTPDVYSAGTSLIDLTLLRRKAPVQQAKLLM